MMAMSRDELIADDVPPIVRVLPDNIDEQEDVERRRMYYDNDNDEEKFSATTRMGADFEPRSNDQQHDEIKVRKLPNIFFAIHLSYLVNTIGLKGLG